MEADDELRIANPTERNIPEIIPVLPLRGTVAFPLAIMPLLIGQARSVHLVDDAMRGNRLALFVAQKTKTTEVTTPDDLYSVGTVGVIDQLARSSDGTLRLIVQGLERVRIVSFTAIEPYFMAKIELLPEEELAQNVEVEGLRRAILDLLRRLVTLIEDLPTELVAAAESLSNIRQLIYLVALMMPLTNQIRQEFLELSPVELKLQRLVELLQHEVTIRELGRKITSDTQERMSKAQRDYILREQMRSIQKELGEGVEQPELAELRKKLEAADLTEEATQEVNRELERLATIPVTSSEYGVIRTYLDWMANLPWNKLSGSSIDIHHARQILDQDHYDLKKIKDRILEYLAVKKLRQERKQSCQGAGKTDLELDGALSNESDRVHEPILCFVGPPGVGKTSLGISIARALNRKFSRISLGGIHDEAEIRGHRRTYIGAMPGRIIQGVKRAETRDAVFMLDEIDKVGADWRGDPSSALLEVLDPAQNNSFVDHYLGVAFDLSQVLFIATANNLDTIPPPLLDRMEVLRLAGYTDEEKICIAEKYLIPKQLKAHSLAPSELSFTTDGLKHIVRGYTREAGVRNLDREIATISRKIARKVAEGEKVQVELTADQVGAYLGRPHFFDEVAERTGKPGIATGLAWTPAGGDVLFVEATMMPSPKEQLILTGMLGDVMRESAQAALSYIRSNTQLLQIDPKILAGNAIHLHVPAGSIPKDGPSAGVTMMTALASLVTGKPVRGDIAMTGEITLRGKVLPVGGIKEKILAAHRAGIKTIILPQHNEGDLEDVAAELRQDLEFIFVDVAEKVLQFALEPEVKANSHQGSL